MLALDPADPRSASVMVAGPAALLVAKVHKIAERAGDPDRSRDKDALDILRLLRAVPTDDLARRLRSLATSELAHRVTREALAEFEARFTDTEAEGVVMAVRAAAGGEDPETIAASLIVLARDVLQATAR